jgi:hypothetical protein
MDEFASPEVEVQVEAERYTARAEELIEAQKVGVWSGVHEALPQMKVHGGSHWADDPALQLNPPDRSGDEKR